MHQCTEVILSTISGSHENDRLQVVLRQDRAASEVLLRQQTWAAGIGWYTQNTVCMAPQQIAQLRGVLGAGISPVASSLAPDQYANRDIGEHSETIPFPRAYSA